MLFSCLVRAIFEPCLCHFRAWFVPRSSLACAIFEPGSFHALSSLVCTIFEPGSCHFRACFRARFVPFSSTVHASFRCNRLIFFAKEITTGYMISYYIFAFFKHCEHFNVKKRVAERLVIDHQVRAAKLQKIVLFTHSADRKL